MEKNLSVPYSSQWDQDAKRTNNDCGPASIKMILNYFGENVTTDQVFDLTGAGKGLISISQMKTGISKLGYTAQYVPTGSVELLKGYIDKGIPVIVLVHYGSLNSTQDKNFKGGHFFVVVGYRDDGYFVNDPNFKDEYRIHGDHHFYKKTEFEKAWNDATLDGNNPRSMIIIQPKAATQPTLIPQHRNVVIKLDEGANVRISPTIQGKNVANSVKKGTVLAVDGYVEGDIVDGNKYWWKMRNENLYVWSGTTDVLPTIDKVEATQPAPSLSQKSREELEEELKVKTDELRAAARGSSEKDVVINNLTTEIQELKNKILKDEDAVNEIATYKTTNQELSQHLEDQKNAYTQKISELKEELKKGKTAAFEGWNLMEIPAGSKALTQVPILAMQIVGLVRDIMKNGYVIGWKKGGKLIRVDAVKTDETRQPVSNLLQ